MVGIIVSDMPRTLAFYRTLELEIASEDDAKPFVMVWMPSGVSIFSTPCSFPDNDRERKPATRSNYNISLEFYAGTRDRPDRTRQSSTIRMVIQF